MRNLKIPKGQEKNFKLKAGYMQPSTKLTVKRMKELAKFIEIVPPPPICPHCKREIYRYIDKKSKCIYCGEYLFPKGIRESDGRFPVNVNEKSK